MMKKAKKKKKKQQHNELSPHACCFKLKLMI